MEVRQSIHLSRREDEEMIDVIRMLVHNWNMSMMKLILTRVRTTDNNDLRTNLGN